MNLTDVDVSVYKEINENIENDRYWRYQVFGFKVKLHVKIG